MATVVGSFSHRYNYDALHRLVYDPSVGNRLLYDGGEAIAEYTSATAVARRFVFGPGVDEPMVWYEGAGTADRRWLHADERGSITAISNAAGNALAINAYDEYGVPKSTNIGRFQYTGQQWLADSAMYYYKARMYVPSIGRFAQTDPIGYGNGPNWYNYVGSDPVNFTDPSGLQDASGATASVCNNGICYQAPTDCDHPEILCVMGQGSSPDPFVISGTNLGLVNSGSAPGDRGNWNPSGESGASPQSNVTAPKPCGGGTGGAVARYAGDAADVLNTLAFASALVGLEPVALGLEGGALLASGVKATAQWRAGDHTGSIVTGVSAVVGSGAAHFAGAAGGEALSKMGERVQATGKGIVGYVAGDASQLSGEAAICPR